ncbi:MULTISPECIES: tannase/feruloyl esterase family alpha/beta hydrolase [Asticcacaulis]|uniref:tannase/feruloyl esterase family alpha/beta hydrolase n=1 Tax=Asticcacaulis TaxID=76890 RepID=UPI001AE0F633|nr:MULTISPECIES: tannase/feruloyl esterase family alpha/beta hydrolase [Asticcacaulis]MBP2161226.1 feruloyl esterase [Asticcacaulis solisilvae]MDR6802271.1 feruloyl esterase [Asticcacaulis sp. BE141]
MRLFLIVILAIMATVMAAQAHAGTGKPLCAALEGRTLTWRGDKARIVSARPVAAASGLPAHCDVSGIMHERQGRFGQAYAIRFHMRLPEAWNSRMVFQGGGGSNGDIGDALGHVSSTGPVALAMGYAVISQDSGHDNATNSDPARNGALAFGFDPEARADYGHASLQASADAAKAVIRAAYGHGPRFSYFVGCSKGGQEGMAFARRYPDIFDGIIASAPGFALPRAAVAEAWDVQAFASLAGERGVVQVADLAKTFSAIDFDLIRGVVLDACDGDDGLKDGMVNDVVGCTDEKVLLRLDVKTCDGAKADACLTPAQVTVLRRVMSGARTARGQAIYSGWFWPASIHAPDWRMWKIGSADGQVPPLNVLLGAPALASVFTSPPTALGNPNAMLDYQLGFDFDRDTSKIYAVADPFTRSAWQDVGARSSNLKAFKARGGRLIVPHGESDPVFSLKDTLAWFDAVDTENGGHAADFVRVFPVPGMCHCGGGAATDRYDMFAALVDWVEHGKAPNAVVAKAGPATPWPDRSRPLCAYPQVARYVGGDVEKAESFKCT